MLKDITLGQFFPGKSYIHKLDPRTKLVLLLIYIVALFVAGDWISYGVMLAFLSICIIISKIPLKNIVRGMKPMMVILIITGLLNIFLTDGDIVWLEIGSVTITQEGVFRAIFMMARILMLVTGTFLLTYTTSPPKT